MGHHVSVGWDQFGNCGGLLFEQAFKFGVTDRAAYLAIMNDMGVVVSDLESTAVGKFSLQLYRRWFVPCFIFAAVGDVAEFGVLPRFKVKAFLQHHFFVTVDPLYFDGSSVAAD